MLAEEAHLGPQLLAPVRTQRADLDRAVAHTNQEDLHWVELVFECARVVLQEMPQTQHKIGLLTMSQETRCSPTLWSCSRIRSGRVRCCRTGTRLLQSLPCRCWLRIRRACSISYRGTGGKATATTRIRREKGRSGYPWSPCIASTRLGRWSSWASGAFWWIPRSTRSPCTRYKGSPM